jgi:hypothetical protein
VKSVEFVRGIASRIGSFRRFGLQVQTFPSAPWQSFCPSIRTFIFAIKRRRVDVAAGFPYTLVSFYPARITFPFPFLPDREAAKVEARTDGRFLTHFDHLK